RAYSQLYARIIQRVPYVTNLRQTFHRFSSLVLPDVPRPLKQKRTKEKNDITMEDIITYPLAAIPPFAESLMSHYRAVNQSLQEMSIFGFTNHDIYRHIVPTAI